MAQQWLYVSPATKLHSADSIRIGMHGLPFYTRGAAVLAAALQ